MTDDACGCWSPTTRPWSATASRMILDAQPDIEVVGEAADGAEAVAAGAPSSPRTSC